ncbi:unnamed protein product [Calypogeia fissa]
MDPEAGIGRSASKGSNGRSQNFEGAGSGRHVGAVLPVKTDPDIEEAIQRWGSTRSASQAKRSSGLGKFSSQSSVSRVDVLAAGGQIEMLPFYDILVKNLTYKVAVKSKEGGPTQKLLLNSVNAEAYHGQILAIVGPSGSGKTTFLDALAGRVASRSLEGEIYVNGELVDDSFKRISGYVMQDDALFPMLTVRETLLYSARLRLSNSMPLAEKKIRVDNMIKQLGLTHCADTRVGNEKVRGASGGERRRVSIGSDLIHDPAVVFLDEPTSGLDSTSALNVMQNLRRMAQTGRRTVVLTIHQPSFRILETIDRVLVLGMGNVIYHGPQRGIKHFFDPLGRSMPEMVNVIEYALDTIEDYQRSPEGLEPLIALQATNKKVLDEEEAKQVKPEEANNVENFSPDYATPFFSECLVLSSRNLKNTLRTPELFLSRVGMMLTVAVTVGTLFLRVKVSAKGVRQRTAFIAFVLALLIFTSTDAIGVFIEERLIFIRETSRGAYRASSYVISGAVVVVPFLLILSILFSTPAYFIVGFVEDAGAFFFFILVVWLTLCMANSFVCFISSMVPNFTVGNSLCSAIIAYFFLFSGFFIPRSGIPKYWIWMHYLSLFKYPYECLVENEFGNKKFAHASWGGQTSEEVLESFSAGAVHQWINILSMILFFLGYRVFFWLVLKFFTKNIRT